MFIYGVINSSPDSLNVDSIATTPDAALARACSLLADGADGLDLGGQGSTDHATVVPWQSEWQRLETIVPALASLGVPLSIDTWRPEVARRALESGANVLNAADGMQNAAMWELAFDLAVPVVLPFLNGPNPREMQQVSMDPLEALISFFDDRLAVADQYGLRDRCILDPGTGFAPPNWPWADRYHYQKRVYTNLDQLRRFGLPLYIALPWKETEQHDELLDIVVRAQPEYGRAHYPARVRQFEYRIG